MSIGGIGPTQPTNSVPSTDIPLNTTDLLIQALTETNLLKNKSALILIDDKQKTQVQQLIREKIFTKIDQYKNPITKLFVRIWYGLHGDILETELRKAKIWIDHGCIAILKPLVILPEKGLITKNNRGSTTLILAIQANRTDIALALIEKMAPQDLAIQDNKGETALFLAIEKGFSDIAQALIEKMEPHGLAIQTNSSGTTALFQAILKSHTDIALALIEKMEPHGLAIQDNKGETALFLAIKKGFSDIALALIKKMEPHGLAIQNNRGSTALLWAIYKGYPDVALALIEKMEPQGLAIKDDQGQTVLFWAIYKGYPDVALALIEKMKPTDLAIKNNQGKTALFWAIEKGFSDIALPIIHKMNPEEDFPAYATLLKGMYPPRLADDVLLILTSGLSEWVSTPKHLRDAEMNLSWLTKPKHSMTTTTASISAAEYDERTRKLKENVLALFRSLKTGTAPGQIHPHSLGSKSLQKINEALTAMVDTMIQKKSWLGTPPDTKPEKLHTFYTEMLVNFESVVNELTQRRDNEQTFSLLFGIAQAELQSRCAAAYQSEILQAKSLLATNIEELTIAARFDAILNTILHSTIEKIVRANFGSDVHAYAQLAYFVGLSSAPDHLSHITQDEGLSPIQTRWNTSVLLEFEASLKRIPGEVLFDWFKDQCISENLTQTRTAMLQKAIAFETERLEQTNKELEQMGFSQTDCATIREWIKKPTSPLLPPEMEAIQKRLSLSSQDVQNLIQMKNTFVKAMEDWSEDQPEAITYVPTDPSGLSFSVPDEDVRTWYAASHFDQNPYRVNEKGIRHIISFTGVAKFQIA